MAKTLHLHIIIWMSNQETLFYLHLTDVQIIPSEKTDKE